MIIGVPRCTANHAKQYVSVLCCQPSFLGGLLCIGKKSKPQLNSGVSANFHSGTLVTS